MRLEADDRLAHRRLPTLDLKMRRTTVLGSSNSSRPPPPVDAAILSPSCFLFAVCRSPFDVQCARTAARSVSASVCRPLLLLSLIITRSAPIFRTHDGLSSLPCTLSSSPCASVRARLSVRVCPLPSARSSLTSCVRSSISRQKTNLKKKMKKFGGKNGTKIHVVCRRAWWRRRCGRSVAGRRCRVSPFVTLTLTQ